MSHTRQSARLQGLPPPSNPTPGEFDPLDPMDPDDDEPNPDNDAPDPHAQSRQPSVPPNLVDAI